MGQKRNRIKQSAVSITFDVFNHILLAAIGVVTLLPLVYVIAASFVPSDVYFKNPVFIIPPVVTLDNYRQIFIADTVPRALLVSFYLTFTGVCISIILNVLTAYPLSRKQLKGRTVISFLITFTLIFNAGIVPLYMVVNQLRLVNTFWAVLLPMGINAWSCLIFKNFFSNIPVELEESARIDGCTDIGILVRIVLPLSKPIIATFVVFFGVNYWSQWFYPTLFLNDYRKWPIQVVLRQFIETAAMSEPGEDQMTIPAEVIKMCIITITTLPIITIYPFAQKYFTKGVLLGSVKG